MTSNFWRLLLNWTQDLKTFLIGWLLVLGLKECLVECATLCVKSIFIVDWASFGKHDFHLSLSAWWHEPYNCQKMFFLQFKHFLQPTPCLQILHLTEPVFRCSNFTFCKKKNQICNYLTHCLQISQIPHLTIFRSSIFTWVWQNQSIFTYVFE